MRFMEAYDGYRSGRLTREAAMLPGVCARSFRRYMWQYEEQALEGLPDKRLNGPSHHKAPVHEVMALVDLYTGRYSGWNIKHFYRFYLREHQGSHSYNWVKNTLQQKGVVKKQKRFGIEMIAAYSLKPEDIPSVPLVAIRDDCLRSWLCTV